MGSSTATTLPFTVCDIVLVDAKDKSYATSIHGEMHNSFLELNILLDEMMRAAA